MDQACGIIFAGKDRYDSCELNDKQALPPADVSFWGERAASISPAGPYRKATAGSSKQAIASRPSPFQRARGLTPSESNAPLTSNAESTSSDERKPSQKRQKSKAAAARASSTHLNDVGSRGAEVAPRSTRPLPSSQSSGEGWEPTTRTRPEQKRSKPPIVDLSDFGIEGTATTSTDAV